MINSEKLFLLALESATPAQLEALLALAEAKGVPLAELIDGAVKTWLVSSKSWKNATHDQPLC